MNAGDVANAVDVPVINGDVHEQPAVSTDEHEEGVTANVDDDDALWLKLPHDVLLLIFARIEAPSSPIPTLLRCALVSRGWNRAASSDSVWERHSSLSWLVRSRALRRQTSFKRLYMHWLREQVDRHYMSMGRMGYMERNYATNTLSFASPLPSKLLIQYAAPPGKGDIDACDFEPHLLMQKLFYSYCNRFTDYDDGAWIADQDLEQQASLNVFETEWTPIFLQFGSGADHLARRGQQHQQGRAGLRSRLRIARDWRASWSASLHVLLVHASMNVDAVFQFLSEPDTPKHSVILFAGMEQVMRESRLGADGKRIKTELEDLVDSLADMTSRPVIKLSMDALFQLDDQQQDCQLGDFSILDDGNDFSRRRAATLLLECMTNLPKSLPSLEDVEQWIPPLVVAEVKRSFMERASKSGSICSDDFQKHGESDQKEEQQQADTGSCVVH